MANGAALTTAIVLLLYWGQVLQMARRARRRTGRAANFIPAERTGRWLRWVWQPVVAGWIAVPLVTAVHAGPLPRSLPRALRPLYYLPPLQWIGAIGVCLMWLAARRCWRHMGRHWRMGIDPAEVTPLLTDGPFAWVRHPIYALSQAMMVCTWVAVPSPLMGFIAILHLTLLHWEAQREEQHLARIHGPAYAAYQAAVGRFVPRRRRGYVPAPA